VVLCFRDDIVNWVRKKIGPPVTILTSTEKTESVLKLETPTVVAYLDNVEVIFPLVANQRVSHISGIAVAMLSCRKFPWPVRATNK
jgi:hypothetical protein